MPELPEVETICRQLEPLIVGKTVVGIEVFNKKSFLGEKKFIGKIVSRKKREGDIVLKRRIYIYIENVRSSEI